MVVVNVKAVDATPEGGQLPEGEYMIASSLPEMQTKYKQNGTKPVLVMVSAYRLHQIGPEQIILA